jgi:hypothetical protein
VAHSRPGSAVCSREVEPARQNEKLMAFLEQRAGQAGTVSLAEAKELLL